MILDTTILLTTAGALIAPFVGMYMLVTGRIVTREVYEREVQAERMGFYGYEEMYPGAVYHHAPTRTSSYRQYLRDLYGPPKTDYMPLLNNILLFLLGTLVVTIAAWATGTIH